MITLEDWQLAGIIVISGFLGYLFGYTTTDNENEEE